MTLEQATAFAHDWVDSWNAHDLDRIMAHYAEELDFCSPLIKQLGADASGVLRSKAALRAYFATGLTRYPDLRFALQQVLPGVQSVVLYYRSINDWPAAEYMELNAQGLVQRVRAHYAAAAAGA
ncbi:nuclear transport factor 2 family protein [Hymenobacter properus]|uniref:Nuclear transport factor 2 family protein n=1 Tax=Hymenobacter properus TaxID=2791026 RepID=A0A931BC21_9BACT|nr:nuclear transport factor 2 family protein [Hymenobacter properus]MBF9141009.1 nuclear transport factor 2 family protein [Hymenobacter properus]MBR7719818.1 nuclear transport factor 2 family protein [Microvirga sp. SRT04]